MHKEYVEKSIQYTGKSSHERRSVSASLQLAEYPVTTVPQINMNVSH